jgi:hypothetical protein
MKMRMIHASALVVLIAVSAAATALVGGCASTESGGSDDCQNLCAQSNACPYATPTDCAKSCATATTLNNASGCASDYSDVLSCAGSQDDVCTTPATACSAQIAAYQSCVETYCIKTPRPTACNAAD